MKRDFPFAFALLVALSLHVLLGIVMKLHPLAIAALAPVPPKAPVTVRFVEVPPNAKTIPVEPKTNNVSDAHRKAGPLVSNPAPRSIGPARSATIQKRNANRGTASAPKTEQPALPAIQSPELPRPSEQQNSKLPEIALTAPNLSQSLKNLDRFIDQNGSESSGDGGEASGDPGSGVFFDTRGFDLGPWGNRIVAIVKSNWLIPVTAELGLKGVVAISFQVDRMGNIQNMQIISSSNIPSFDQAALNALKTSNPLPPLPGDFPRALLPAIFRFYYNLPVPE